MRGHTRNAGVELRVNEPAFAGHTLPDLPSNQFTANRTNRFAAQHE
jgi:hypothetical protein